MVEQQKSSGRNTLDSPAEHVYHAWNEALSHNDAATLTDLYAPDAVLESPLIPHLTGLERPIRGRAEIRAFLDKVAENKPPVRQYYRTGYLKDGRRVIWEYPPAAPDGEQMDFVEAMELNDDGLIQRHCVYWGWFGFGVMKRGEYHKSPESHAGPKPATLAGYDYGTDKVPTSPVTMPDLAKVEESAGLTGEDRRYLAMAGEVLADQAEKMVDSWRARIGKQEHLARWFFGPDGKPDERYKAAVKPRFVQWVIDTCTRPYDQAWLDYQDEIGRRHTPEKKNRTDGVQAPPVVPLRYVLAFTAVVITTSKEFLAAKGHSPSDVDGMHAAWTKAVLLSLALWSRPYAKEGLW
jgi:hypothetical protein